MTRLFHLLTIFILLSCNDSVYKKPGKATLQIDLKIVPASDSSYTITWTDTLGHAKGYSLRNRPYELICFFIDSKDTAGYYNGLSSPTNFTYITTKDSMVTAYFEMKLNFFTDAFSMEERKEIFKTKKEIKFESVKINLKQRSEKTVLKLIEK